MLTKAERDDLSRLADSMGLNLSATVRYLIRRALYSSPSTHPDSEGE